jgi:hypothetical protein
MAALEIQAAGYRRPSLSVAGLVEQLAGVAPDFAARASVLLGLGLLVGVKKILLASGFHPEAHHI